MPGPPKAHRRVEYLEAGRSSMRPTNLLTILLSRILQVREFKFIGCFSDECMKCPARQRCFESPIALQLHRLHEGHGTEFKRDMLFDLVREIKACANATGRSDPAWRFGQMLKALPSIMCLVRRAFEK